MYLEHYGLSEPPFSITPDPRFVFLSERHRDALAHLLFGIGQGGGGGFVQLTGEVGTGKTTLCRLLLEQLPENTRVALVLNPRLTPVELLETICEELHLDLEGRRGSLKALVDALNAYLLDAYAQGLRVVLIIDEAQNLSVDALEQVRLLTNLETPTQKLLQIVLLGQPELRAMLARDELRQLAQRITARYHLTPLDADRDRRVPAPSLPRRRRPAFPVQCRRGQAHPCPFRRRAAADQRHRRAQPAGRLCARCQPYSTARWVDRAASEVLPRADADMVTADDRSRRWRSLRWPSSCSWSRRRCGGRDARRCRRPRPRRRWHLPLASTGKGGSRGRRWTRQRSPRVWACDATAPDARLEPVAGTLAVALGAAADAALRRSVPAGAGARRVLPAWTRHASMR